VSIFDEMPWIDARHVITDDFSAAILWHRSEQKTPHEPEFAIGISVTFLLNFTQQRCARPITDSSTQASARRPTSIGHLAPGKLH
jgi:hypothetical protein